MHFPIVHFLDVLPVISIKDGILSIHFHWKGPDAKFLHCMKFQDQGSLMGSCGRFFFGLLFFCTYCACAYCTGDGISKQVDGPQFVVHIDDVPDSTRRIMLEELLKFEKDRLAPLTVKE